MDAKKPDIFICKPTLKIFDTAIGKLQDILGNIPAYVKIDGLNAAYLYAYSVYEGALFQIYREIARSFPKRVEIKYKDSYSSIIQESTRMSVLVDSIVHDFTLSFGHKKFGQLKRQFNGIVQIDLKNVDFPEQEINAYKEKRDKLAHQGIATISENDVNTHIKAAMAVLKLIKEKFVARYSKYTSESLCRDACNYLFGMNNVIYDRCFWRRENENYIHLEGIQHWFSTASSSEKHLFMLYIANYSYDIVNNLSHARLMPTVSLDEYSLEKVSYINELFRRYPHLLQFDPNY